MRLIDADALKKAFKQSPFVNDVHLYYARQLINLAHTVEERPHGEWEHWGSPFTDDTIANSIVCSLCKARYVEIEGEAFNFCPNCGAFMQTQNDRS